MPRISRFYGINIFMYWNDHQPPHFHARYGKDQALISITDFDVVAGALPANGLRLVKKWAKLHQEELLDNWELCRNQEQPMKIDPLE